MDDMCAPMSLNSARQPICRVEPRMVKFEFNGSNLSRIEPELQPGERAPSHLNLARRKLVFRPTSTRNQHGEDGAAQY